MVYHAREDLRDIFVTEIDEIRIKNLYPLRPMRWRVSHLKRDGKDWTFTRKALPQGEGNKKNGEPFQWESADGIKAEHTKMIAILDEIADIKCSKYIYDAKPEEDNNPMYVIVVRDKNEHTLNVYPKKEDDYRAKSSDNPSQFYLYAWRIDKIRDKFREISGVNNGKKPDA